MTFRPMGHELVSHIGLWWGEFPLSFLRWRDPKHAQISGSLLTGWQTTRFQLIPIRASLSPDANRIIYRMVFIFYLNLKIPVTTTWIASNGNQIRHSILEFTSHQVLLIFTQLLHAWTYRCISNHKRTLASYNLSLRHCRVDFILRHSELLRLLPFAKILIVKHLLYAKHTFFSVIT